MRIIDVGVFSECSALKSLVIPEGITEIKYCAFEDCKSLEELEIPASVEFIDEEAFQGCTALKHVTVKCPIRINQSILPLRENPGIKTLTFGENVKVSKQGFWEDSDEWTQNLEAIYVPGNCVKYYKSRIPKSLHHLIKELPPEA